MNIAQSSNRVVNSFPPLNNITPFTRVDGWSFLEILEGLRYYVVEVLVSDIDSNNKDISDQLNKWFTQYVKDFENLKGDWQELFDNFMANIVIELEGLNDQAVANLVVNKLSDLHGALATRIDYNSRYINARGDEATKRGISLVADGTLVDSIAGGTNNTANLNALVAWSKESKRPLYIPAGKYFVPGEIDISGANIFGDSSGYYNANGTVIIGNRSGITFNQKSVKTTDITMSLSWLRFENTNTAVRVSYSVYSKFSYLTVVSSWDASFICGDPSIIGGLWNEFNRCQFDSLNAQALIIGGKDWANNTVLNTCDLRTRNRLSAAVEFNTSGGFGAVNTIFNDCEIRGDGYGVKFATQTNGTKFNNCYNETRGPLLWIQSACTDLHLNGGIYGSLKNDHPSGVKSFIFHEKGGCDLRVNGGWVTISSTGADVAGLSFIDSVSPATLLLMYTQRPRFSISAADWKMHAKPEIEERDRIFLGGLTVQKNMRPGFKAAYSDGSNPFVLERNGSFGGADEGVVFKNDGISSWTVNSAGRFRVLESIGLPEFVMGTRAGVEGLYAKVYDTASGAPRYIQAYTGTDVQEI